MVDIKLLHLAVAKHQEGCSEAFIVNHTRNFHENTKKATATACERLLVKVFNKSENNEISQFAVVKH